MKHHFMDILDRSLGHWSIVPNAMRHHYRPPDALVGMESATILTLTGDDPGWRDAMELPHLAELTLHEPSLAQIASLHLVTGLRRLRISFARIGDLAVLGTLAGVEELVLEYVSGFDDLSALAQMPALRALHLENLRGVTSFDGLRDAGLRYLHVHGTMDWAQPIASLDFLSTLADLETFGLGNVRLLDNGATVGALTQLPALRKIALQRNLLPLAGYALLEAHLPGVAGAAWQPASKVSYKYHDIPVDDARARFPAIVMAAQYPDVVLLEDGRRIAPDESSAWYEFLGKGARSIACSRPNAQAKLAEACARYRALVAAARA